MARRGRLRFELDGPGASPETVASLLLLRLAQQTFQLLTKVADTSGASLTLAGMAVRDKCVAIDVSPSDREAAELSARRVIRLVAGQERPPRGLTSSVEALQRELRGLPAGMRACVQATGRAKRLLPPPLPTVETPWETTELRVTPVRVGGAEPGAQLTSTSELGPFTVEATADVARKLGALLYRDVDVVLDIVRGIDGRIERGRVVDVMPLSAEEPTATWRQWFATNAPEWFAVDDVRGELGRGTED